MSIPNSIYLRKIIFDFFLSLGNLSPLQRISLVNLRGQQVISAQLHPGVQTLSLSVLTIAPGHYLAHRHYRSPAQTKSGAVQIVPVL
jgi:hypothetical protein